MKIDDIRPHRNLTGTGKTTAPGGGEVDFAEVLKSHLLGPRGAAPAGAADALHPTAPAIPAQLRLEGLQLSETTISTLDSFSAALGNTAFKTEELEPFVNALESDLQAMLALRRELPTQDPLSSLLEQVAAVSHLEAAKYRRGDYN